MAGPIRIAILANAAQAKRELSSVSSTAEKLGKYGKIAGAGLLSGVTGLAIWGAKSAISLQTATMNLTTLTGSAKTASKMVQQLNKYGNATTFDTAGLTKAAQQMLTYGIRTKDVIPDIKLLGDISMGNQEKLSGLAFAFSQVQGNGHLMGQDLNQLINAGFNPLAYMVKRTGKSMGELRKEMAAGNISFQDVQQAMEDATKKGARFYQGAANGSKTVAGAWGNLTGTISSTLGMALQPLLPLVQKALAALSDFASSKSGSIRSAVLTVVADIQKLEEPAKNLGLTLEHDVLPPLKTLGTVAVKLTGFLLALPDPVKRFGVEVGLAALVVPRLIGVLDLGGAALTRFAGNVRNAETRTAALGRAARTAGGIAGMAALADGAQRAGSQVGFLETTAGGALLGFSVGGPWGAAIGAGAGALMSLQQAADRANQEFQDGVTFNQDYAGSLDQVTGAVTRLTKQTIYKNFTNDGTFTFSRLYGLPDRDVVAAATGNAQALIRIKKRLDQAVRSGKLDAGFESDFLHKLGADKAEIDAAARAIQRQTSATEGWGKALRGLPKKVFVALKQTGFEPSLKQLRDLARQYHLTPKQLKLIIRQTGADFTVKQVLNLHHHLDDTKHHTAAANAALHNVGRTTVAPQFRGSLDALLSNARSDASTGGHEVGSALKSGVIAGFAGTEAILAAQAAAAVRNAAYAAKRAGMIRSPSRVFAKIGQQLGDGLVKGLKDRHRHVKKAGDELVKQAIKAAKQGGSQLTSVLSTYLDKHTKLTDKQIKHLLASHKKLSEALVKQEKRLAGVNDKLAKAKTKYNDLVKAQKDYAASIKASVVSSGDITQLNSPFTPQGIVGGLQHAVDKAKLYAQLLERLKKAGLNKTTLQQLLDAGVDGGLATAQALAQGIGKGTVKQVNALTAQLQNIGGDLGTSMGHTMYDSGVKAAQGLVDGLQSKENAITKMAHHIAATLVREVKAGLKIHSPSRVFQEIGLQTVQGLSIGLDDTYVKRSGQVLAKSLVTGFANPKLTASAALDKSQLPQTQNTYQITVQAPVGSSSADIGRTIVQHINAYERAGGRKRS